MLNHDIREEIADIPISTLKEELEENHLYTKLIHPIEVLYADSVQFELEHVLFNIKIFEGKPFKLDANKIEEIKEKVEEYYARF